MADGEFLPGKRKDLARPFLGGEGKTGLGGGNGKREGRVVIIVLLYLHQGYYFKLHLFFRNHFKILANFVN